MSAEPYDQDENRHPWWTIRQDALLNALRRVEAGESADVVITELWLESDTESYSDDGDEP